MLKNKIAKSLLLATAVTSGVSATGYIAIKASSYNDPYTKKQQQIEAENNPEGHQTTATTLSGTPAANNDQGHIALLEPGTEPSTAPGTGIPKGSLSAVEYSAASAPPSAFAAGVSAAPPPPGGGGGITTPGAPASSIDMYEGILGFAAFCFIVIFARKKII